MKHPLTLHLADDMNYLGHSGKLELQSESVEYDQKWVRRERYFDRTATLPSLLLPGPVGTAIGSALSAKARDAARRSTRHVVRVVERDF